MIRDVCRRGRKGQKRTSRRQSSDGDDYDADSTRSRCRQYRGWRDRQQSLSEQFWLFAAYIILRSHSIEAASSPSPGRPTDEAQAAGQPVQYPLAAATRKQAKRLVHLDLSAILRAKTPPRLAVTSRTLEVSATIHEKDNSLSGGDHSEATRDRRPIRRRGRGRSRRGPVRSRPVSLLRHDCYIPHCLWYRHIVACVVYIRKMGATRLEHEIENRKNEKDLSNSLVLLMHSFLLGCYMLSVPDANAGECPVVKTIGRIKKDV